MNAPIMLETYGCGPVLRHELSAVELPPETKSYCPVGHDYLVDIAEDSLSDFGFRFGEQNHGLSHDGRRYFGVIELLHSTPNSTFSLMLGLRNSLDKRFPAGLAFGARVMVCANLSFGGEHVVGRKHTPNIMRDLPNLIWAAVSNLKALQFNQEARFECYQERQLSDRNADHLILNLLRNGVINTQRVEKVVKEWDEPSHDFGGRTVWRMFNAVTESLKGVNIHEMPKRTIGLQALCDQSARFRPAVNENDWAAAAA